MSARAPDPHNLRTAAEHAAPIIDTDRKCLGCGYNLRGLRLGFNCPECGLSSVLDFSNDDPLSNMPLNVILALVRGCWLASICIVVMVGVVMVERFKILDHAVAMAILAGLSMVWIGSVWLLTPAFAIPQAVSRGFSQRSRTRRAARWLQWGWLLATGAAALAAFSSPSGSIDGLLSFAMMSGIVVGLSGLVVLSILMERLADWVRDEDAQRMFNWAMWSWPLAMLVYVPIQLFIGSWLVSTGRGSLGAGLFVLLWVFAIGTFPYGLLMLAKSVTLAIVHNIEYRDRSERKQERDQRFHKRGGEIAAQTEPQPMKPKPAKHVTRPAQPQPQQPPRKGSR